MNWAGWAVWGFAATVVLTTVLVMSQGVKWTRMSITLMLGTMVTTDRDKAKWYGIFIHMLNGYIFSLVYVAAFHAWHGASWQKGAVIGLVHSLFVLTVALPGLPAVHPRMASEYRIAEGPRVLEPPGFMASNYGWSTAWCVVAAHLIFGIILGTFYRI